MPLGEKLSIRMSSESVCRKWTYVTSKQHVLFQKDLLPYDKLSHFDCHPVSLIKKFLSYNFMINCLILIVIPWIWLKSFYRMINCHFMSLIKEFLPYNKVNILIEENFESSNIYLLCPHPHCTLRSHIVSHEWSKTFKWLTPLPIYQAYAFL